MNSRRRVAAALGSLALALGLIETSVAAAATRSAPSRSTALASIAKAAPPIGHVGRWLVDAHGQVLLIHGVNVSMKGSLAQSQAYKFGADDAAFLAANGFNAVRLTVERYDIEPTAGNFDTSYLQFIRHTVQVLSSYGVMTLIDFHQDEFGPVFHDNGYPSWMTQTGGQANLYQPGFPYQYLMNPAVENAFDTLWKNGNDSRGTPLWDDDAELIQHTVAYLDHTRGVLGYEIINEPWPGSQYPTCVTPLVGCPSFDEGALSSYYARMDSAIRAVDSQHLVFYEPLVTFDYGIPTSVLPPPGDKELAFAFHDYPLCTFDYNAGLPPLFDTECGVESRVALNNAFSHERTHPDALINDEFGAGAPPTSITKSVSLYDTKMLPWMFWSYQEVAGIDSDGAFTTPPTDTPHRGVLSSLARPYPQLVAGVPSGYSYNATSHVFIASYSTEHVTGGGSFGANAVSQFSIPRPAYPQGYTVSVTGGQVVSGDNDVLLLIAADPGAKRVTITVTPA